jgi:hypothetical protein
LSLQIRITPWIPANFFLYDVHFTSSYFFNAYQCLNGNARILEKKKVLYADFAFIYNFFDISIYIFVVTTPTETASITPSISVHTGKLYTKRRKNILKKITKYCDAVSDII